MPGFLVTADSILVEMCAKGCSALDHFSGSSIPRHGGEKWGLTLKWGLSERRTKNKHDSVKREGKEDRKENEKTLDPVGF